MGTKLSAYAGMSLLAVAIPVAAWAIGVIPGLLWTNGFAAFSKELAALVSLALWGLALLTLSPIFELWERVLLLPGPLSALAGFAVAVLTVVAGFFTYTSIVDRAYDERASVGSCQVRDDDVITETVAGTSKTRYHYTLDCGEKELLRWDSIVNQHLKAGDRVTMEYDTSGDLLPAKKLSGY